FSSRRRHTRFSRDWSSDVCSSDLFNTYESSSITAGGHQQITQQVEAYCGSCGYTTHSINNGQRVMFQCLSDSAPGVTDIVGLVRSEERRVGKECRSGCWE